MLEKLDIHMQKSIYNLYFSPYMKQLKIILYLKVKL
jgi:hypothetical protein